MLPDIGFTEYLVIAVAALVFIGPKDLPKVLRTLGGWVAKMRGMASEFRVSFEEMARQSELDELRKEVEAMRQGQLINPAQIASDHMGATEIQNHFNDIEQSLKGDGAAMLNPPMGHHYMTPLSPEAPAVAVEPALPVDGPAEGGPVGPKPRRTRKKA